ncbi:MAG: bifunctional aldolase/short-chain dehydrogenase [Acidimicrobiales bacterium]
MARFKGGLVVRNRWDDAEAARFEGELGLRVYTSRLLGADPDLVLHGGGNTSLKSRVTGVFGDEVEVLMVKGSGADLSEVTEEGFASLRLADVVRLTELDELSDPDMAEQLLVASTRAGGPAPSVEAILHAVLPFRFVDHTHADAVVTLTNTPAAESILGEVYGDEVVVLPYVMPGFKLAKACARRVPDVRAPGVVGVVLMNHGIFTWGDTARESYDRMIDLVSRAERYVAARRQPAAAATGPAGQVRHERAALRQRVSTAFGAPVVMSSHTDATVMGFIGRPDVDAISQRGPATPDHVIRTKPWPLLGRDVEEYAGRYRAYVDRHRRRDIQPLDPAPRVILDPELGMACVGRTARDAGIAEDIYRHTMKAILDADALGGWQPITEADLFDMEYWDLEQAKLRRQPPPAPFAGEVALVTGAANGIGRACAEALLAEGAAVVGIDVNPEIKAAFRGPAWLGLETDVTDAVAVEAAYERAVERFGGVDVLVLNAGIFVPGMPLADLDPGTWRRVLAINLDANALLLREAYPVLRLSPRGGRVVVVGSKNVAAPGPGAAAYSASKAALTQLARVVALEWGDDGIRVNVIHPDAVFDTGVWTDDVLAERAAHYGMTVEDYRRRNVLGTDVTSADVARMCVVMCGPAFAKTTGAQVPVDGGNDRVI